MTQELSQKDYETALKNGLDPIYVPSNILDSIKKNCKDIITKSIANGYSDAYSQQSLQEQSQETINSFFENNGNIHFLSDKHKANMPKELLNKAFSNTDQHYDALHILHAQDDQAGKAHEDIPQKLVNEAFSNGIGDFDAKKLSNIPQKNINEGVSKGGSTLSQLLYRQSQLKSDIKILEDKHYSAFRNGNYTATAEDKRAFQTIAKLKKVLEALNKKIKAIPQESIKSYFENGGNAFQCESYLKDQPTEVVNKFIANGGSPDALTDSQFDNISIKAIVQRASNVSEQNFEEFADYIPNNVINKLPKSLKASNVKENPALTNALVQYSIGSKTLKDLPPELFVNYESRKALLKISKIRDPKNYASLKKLIKEKQQSSLEEIIKEIERGTKVEKFAETQEGKKSLQEEREQREQNQKKATEATTQAQMKEKNGLSDEQKL